jgi:hypothetical protein
LNCIKHAHCPTVLETDVVERNVYILCHVRTFCRERIFEKYNKIGVEVRVNKSWVASGKNQ